jgi:hypothetical protein
MILKNAAGANVTRRRGRPEMEEEFSPLLGLMVFMIYGFAIGVIVGVML